MIRAAHNQSVEGEACSDRALTILLCCPPQLTNVMYTTAPDGGLEPRIDLASARRGSMKPGTVERTILATTNKEIKDQSCFLVTSQLGVKSNVKGLGRKGSDAAYTTAPQDPLAESGFDYGALHGCTPALAAMIP